MILGFKKAINGVATNFDAKVGMYLGVVDRTFGYTTKSLTLRDDPNDRWQPGRKIHFATGVRTKDYECFAMGKCTDTARIWFQWKGGLNGGYQLIDPDRPTMHIYYIFHVAGKALSLKEATQLATDDGFDSLQAFFDFHYKARKDKNDLYWAKKIIYF